MGWGFVFGERSESPMLILNLCVKRRYSLGEGGLVSTLAGFSDSRFQGSLRYTFCRLVSFTAVSSHHGSAR